MSNPSPSKIRKFFSRLNVLITYVVAAAGILALLGLFCAVFLFWFFDFAVFPFQRAWETRAWQETPCTITRSEVEKHEDRKRPYSPGVEYTYSYGGREYEGNRRSLAAEVTKETTRPCHRIVRKYPVGSERVCYVNPDRPSESVLHRGYTWGSILFGLLSPTAILFFLPYLSRLDKGRTQAGAQGPAELRGQRLVTFRWITTVAVIYAALALITAMFLDGADPFAVCLGVFTACVPWYLFIALRSLLNPRLTVKVFVLAGSVVWGVGWALWLFQKAGAAKETPFTALGMIVLCFLAVSLMLLLLHRVFRYLARRDPSPVDTEGRVKLCSQRLNTSLTIFATLFVSINILGPTMAIFLYFYPNSPNPGGLGTVALISIAPLYIFIASRGFRGFSDPRLTVSISRFPLLADEEFEVEWKFRTSTARLRKLSITLEGTIEERGKCSRFKTIHIFETEDPLAIAEGKARCAVPADARPSGVDGDTKVMWNLCFHGPSPTRPALHEEFEVLIARGEPGMSKPSPSKTRKFFPRLASLATGALKVAFHPFIYVLALAPGLVLAYFSLGGEAWEARAWHETPCTITRSEVEEYEQHDDGRSVTRYAPRVEYTYSYGGREYRGNRYSCAEQTSETPEPFYRVVNKYPAGSEQVCYVNPDRPSESVLWRGHGWGTIVLVLLSVSTMLFLLHRVLLRRVIRPFLRRGLPLGAQDPVELPNPRNMTFYTIWATIFAGFITVGVPVYIASFFYLDGANPFEIGFYVLMAIFPLCLAFMCLASLRPGPTVKAFPFPVHAGEDLEVEWKFGPSAERLRKLAITLEGTKEGWLRRSTFKTIHIFESEDPLAFAQGKARCAVPADARPSRGDGDTEVTWNLCFHGAIPIPTWPDVHDEFEVPIARRSPRTSKPSPSRIRKFLPRLASLAALVLWGSMLLLPVQRASAPRAWQETPCTITRSEVEEYEYHDDDRSEMRYAPRVEHTYSYGGREYRGNRYTRDEKCFSRSRRPTLRVVNKYPAGSERVCYVNPDWPSESVLWRGYGWGTTVFALLSLPIILLLLHRALRRFWRVDSSPDPAQAPVELASQRPITFLTIGSTLAVGFTIAVAPWGIASFFYLDSANPFGIGFPVFLFLMPLYLFLVAPRSLFSPRLTAKAFPFPVSAEEEFEIEWEFGLGAERFGKLTITLEGTKRGWLRRSTFKTIHIFETEDPLAFAQGKALCTIPADARPSGEDGDAKVTWNLCFHGAVPIPTRPDAHEEFEVKIEPGRADA